MNISFFRSRTQGPEKILEDLVTTGIDKVVPVVDYPSWIACSPIIGAGMPDILFAYYKPAVFALAGESITQTQILAYLRAVNYASLKKIVHHCNHPEKKIKLHLDQLINQNVVKKYNEEYWLEPGWRDIIPILISIEVKVDNWKKAVSQASRNRLFSHQSYIAMPIKKALQIRDNAIFSSLGIGLLSIDDIGIRVEISASSFQPQIWEYYYKVAKLLANSRQDNQLCLSSSRLTKPENGIQNSFSYQL